MDQVLAVILIVSCMQLSIGGGELVSRLSAADSLQYLMFESTHFDNKDCTNGVCVVSASKRHDCSVHHTMQLMFPNTAVCWDLN